MNDMIGKRFPISPLYARYAVFEWVGNDLVTYKRTLWGIWDTSRGNRYEPVTACSNNKVHNGGVREREGRQRQ